MYRKVWFVFTEERGLNLLGVSRIEAGFVNMSFRLIIGMQQEKSNLQSTYLTYNSGRHITSVALSSTSCEVMVATDL